MPTAAPVKPNPAIWTRGPYARTGGNARGMGRGGAAGDWGDDRAVGAKLMQLALF